MRTLVAAGLTAALVAASPAGAATVVEGEWGVGLTTTCGTAPAPGPGLVPAQTVMRFEYGCTARYAAWPVAPAVAVFHLRSAVAGSGVACGQWMANGPGFAADTGSICVALNTTVVLPLVSSAVSNGPTQTHIRFYAYPNGIGGASTVPYATVTGHLDFYVTS